MRDAPTQGLRTGGLSDLLRCRAVAQPDRTLLWTAGEILTYAEAEEQVDRLAAGLQEQGIGLGDRVLLLMGNSATQVLLWLAIDRVGGVDVPVNTALSTGLLTRAVRTIGPSLVVVDPEQAAQLVDVLRDSGTGAVPVYVAGSPSVQPSTLGFRSLEALSVAGPVVRPQADDLAPAVMLFTSGSTGVPKACVLSRRYVVRAGQLHVKYLRLTPEDVLFTPFPLFHIDAATLTVGAALAAGATAALASGFSASRFWDEVRASGATVFNFMGATANILWKRPAGEHDRDHRVRLAWGVPMPACEPQWADRFGFPLVEVYGLTDAGVPAYQPLGEPRVPGSCGRVIPEYALQIGDADSAPLPTGEVGEIQIRANEPGLLMTEYFGMPEATAEAFRGGWFHTGDAARLDADGNLFFVSRAKEVIRRRGENIAATDVEQGVDAHPGVRESAAVGVPSGLTEDDIKVFVVLQPGAALKPHEVLEHCRSTLPRYMVPRYVELRDALPKTPTEKIERATLAALPLTSATWDGESNSPWTDRLRQEAHTS